MYVGERVTINDPNRIELRRHAHETERFGAFFVDLRLSPEIILTHMAVNNVEFQIEHTIAGLTN